MIHEPENLDECMDIHCFECRYHKKEYYGVYNYQKCPRYNKFMEDIGY